MNDFNNYEDKNSLELFINEIERSIESKNYLIALHMALSIPDMLGKLVYSDLNVFERYQRWFDENVIETISGQLYSKNPLTLPSDFPEMNGAVCYMLRCKFFHEGINDINYGKANNIDEFVLSYTDSDFVNGKSAGYVAEEFNDGTKHYYNKYLYVSCRGLCKEIVNAAKTFFVNNPNLNYPKIRINNRGGKYLFF